MIGRIVPLVVALAAGVPLGAQSGQVILATTTSVRDAGLLDTLLPPFERRTGITVRVLAVGSGQAMELARRGEADIVILHDPANEERFVADGFGVDRQPLMENEFVLVGPAADAAGVRGQDAVEAFHRIASAGARFISRGDRSGTHARERRVWEAAGIEPVGEWYGESGQGMGATLVIADQLRAYTLTDIGTWLANRAPLALTVLVEGDALLVNPYHVIRVNPDRFHRLNAEAAQALADYLLSGEARDIIAGFGVARFGRALFRPATAIARP